MRFASISKKRTMPLAAAADVLGSSSALLSSAVALALAASMRTVSPFCFCCLVWGGV
jgi:hypothetical protein